MLSLAGMGLTYGLEGMHRLYSKDKGWDKRITDLISIVIKGVGVTSACVTIVRALHNSNKGSLQEYQTLLDSVPGDYFGPE